MSEKPRYENISKIDNILKGKNLETLSSGILSTEKDILALIKNINDSEKEIEARNLEVAKRAAEEQAKIKQLADEKIAADAAVASKQTPAQDQPIKEDIDKDTKVKETASKSEQDAVLSIKKSQAPVKSADEQKVAESTKTAENEKASETLKTIESVKTQENAKVERTVSRGARTDETKSYTPQENRRTYTPSNQPQTRQGGRQYDGGARPYNNQGQTGARPYNNQGQTGARPYNNQGQTGARPYNQGQTGARPYNNQGQTGARPYSQGQSGGVQNTFVPPVKKAGAPSEPSRVFSAKKKVGDKNYDDKKNTVSKRALIKQSISVDDFDENKTGYRKLRLKKQKPQQQSVMKIEKAVLNSDVVPLKVLSEKLGVSAVEITKMLFKENIFKTINDTIDFDTAELVAANLDIELELKMEKTAEEVLTEVYDSEEEAENLVSRPPVVTVMGHVDHGKTSLLDRLRKTNVTAGEAGGITQHIGAYTVSINGKKITFIDTPGHSAFTAMRARGAKVTDIAIIVVAADDGIMPQTVEAVNHAKAADVSIIVAVNKIDKQDANIERIKQQMTDNGLVPEEWGGDVIVCPVSAKTGEGIESLLENINLIAELKELKANPDTMARGVIIEAQLDRGKGPVASLLIQNGTLKAGDSVLSGTTFGRVRAMTDDKGKPVKEAGPSTAVSILGLEEVPVAGDNFYAVEKGKLIKSVADERKRIERESMIQSRSSFTLDDIFGKIAEGNIKGLNIILKADVQGTVEAVKQSLEKLSDEEVRINVIHSAAGAINESDIMLAETSKAIVIGFNVRCDAKSKTIAERSGVDVRTYRVIYELLDDIDSARKGMLEPKYREEMTGKCEVRETFRITGVGMVAGCYVTDGKLVRGGKLRIYRDDILIVEGNVQQLKRFKDDVKEVASGYECGVSIENFNDIKVGDIIECYIREQIKV